MKAHRWMLVAALMAVACKAHAPRSPEKLRDAHVGALEANDPAKAYALLTPELKATVSYAEFLERWNADAADRRRSATQGRALDPALRAPVYEGTTVHDGGRVLRWTRLSDGYVVVDGLPGIAQTQTPAQAVRALIDAVRTTDLSSVRRLLGDDLAHALTEDWHARVEALEVALERPGSIELSPDLRRAELRYEPNRVLTMEQTPGGWRITTLE